MKKQVFRLFVLIVGLTLFLDASAASAQESTTILSSKQWNVEEEEVVQQQIYLPYITRSCLPLFDDDFSDPNSGWPVGDDEDILFEYIDGEYRILVRNPYWIVDALPGFQASDYILAVDVRNANSNYGSYGLLFGLSYDLDQFYTFEIASNGNYGIFNYNNTGWTLLAEGWSADINTGAATNRLKIKRNGDLIEAYANGALLTSVTDGSYTGIGYVGLIVLSDETDADVRFDNFTVYPVNCP